MTGKLSDNTSDHLNNIAVLIDADNASAKNIGSILAKIEKHGVIGCKKIYGDWGNAHIKSWQEALLKYAIEPMQQFAYVKGKNASDIAMVIDTMDLLHSGNYDGFCLVSSDSDFTSLAIRIRKNNIKVFGFGKKNTVDSFTHACDKFFYVEDLVKPIASKPVAFNAPLPQQTHIISIINNIIKADPNAHNRWSNLSYIASQLSQQHRDIQISEYGFNKFSDFIIALRAYDIRRQDNGMWAKYRPAKAKLASNTKAIKTSKPKPSGNQQNESKVCDTLLETKKLYITITSDTGIDAILYRLTASGKVRGDEDMIFYGQTHSEDNIIELHQEQEVDQDTGKTVAVAEFQCDLEKQTVDIKQLAFVLASDSGAMRDHKDYPNVNVSIVSATTKAILFQNDFDLSQKPNDNILLITLSREGAGWRIKPIHKSLDNSLAEICEQYGIEISES